MMGQLIDLEHFRNTGEIQHPNARLMANPINWAKEQLYLYNEHRRHLERERRKAEHNKRRLYDARSKINPNSA